MIEYAELKTVRPSAFALLPPARPLTILILARDEADVLGPTLAAIQRKMTPVDRLCVVADHCSDSTAQVARRSGADVFRRRDDEPQGKGAALRWWLEQTADEAQDDEGIVILDADSRPGAGLFECLRSRLARGEVAIQARLEPLLPAVHGGAVPRLAALSETVEQRVFDALKARWGWPVRLHGTGMAFTRSVLRRAALRLTSPAEDAELTILLAGWGVPISLALETCVVDPKPRDVRGAVSQRARWFRGQAEILRRQPASIGALLRRGPSGWALLASVFLQPKSVFVPLKAFLALASVASWNAGHGYGWLALAGILAGTLAIDFAGLAAGLWLSPHRRQVARALCAWPVFLAVWLASLGLTLVSRRGWHRVRPETAAKPRRHEA